MSSSITLLDLLCTLDMAALTSAMGTEDQVGCGMVLEDLGFEEQFGVPSQVFKCRKISLISN